MIKLIIISVIGYLNLVLEYEYKKIKKVINSVIDIIDEIIED